MNVTDIDDKVCHGGESGFAADWGYLYRHVRR
jgi:hypothetical protein